MPRANKRDRLLSKLSRSLDGPSPAPAADHASATAAAAAGSPLAPSPTPAKRDKPARSAGAAPRSRPRAPHATVAASPVALVAAATPAADAPETTPEAPTSSPAPSLRPAAEQLVRQHLPLAVGAGLIPLPLADLVAIGSLQLRLLRALARHYDVPFTRGQAEPIVTSLLGSVGGTALACSLLGSVAKFVPGAGALLSFTTLPAASGAVTYAIGHLAIDHFESGGTLESFDLDVAQAAFARKFAEYRQRLTTSS